MSSHCFKKCNEDNIKRLVNIPNDICGNIDFHALSCEQEAYYYCIEQCHKKNIKSTPVKK